MIRLVQGVAELRNLFDQYWQPENRVTHALMTALNEDRRLLGLFLRELVHVRAPVSPARLSVLEQRYPGEPEAREDEVESRGIPDGWIYDEKGAWCVFIESKVLARLDVEQIRRHRGTAERRGFRKVIAVAIAPRFRDSLPADVVPLEWRTIYIWLRRHARQSDWASRAATYLEISEAKLIEAEQFTEGTLTTFTGFPFSRDHPYTYLEGKRILGLALSELRHRRDLKKTLGMNPTIPGRPAITGRQEDRVWDFLSLSPASSASNFTHHPHLTMGLRTDAAEAMVTIPNAVNGTMRANLKGLGEEGFVSLVEGIVSNLKPLLKAHKGATPWFRGIQRRYPSQRAVPIIDAMIEFDLRTALPGGPPKNQLRWLSAAYASYVQKEHSNYQMQIGVIYRYERCPELNKPSATDLIATAWLGCKPLVDLSR